MASDNEVVSVLKEARRLLAEKDWTKGEHARDADGCDVPYHDPSAVCFCAEGAILCAAEAVGVEGDLALVAFQDACGDRHIPRFNDAPGRTKADILDAFSRAIAAAQTEGRS